MMMMIIVLCCHIRIPAEAKCSRFKNSLHSKDCFDEEGGVDYGDDDGDDDDDDEGHLLLCLPWDNWTLPDSELG